MKKYLALVLCVAVVCLAGCSCVPTQAPVQSGSAPATVPPGGAAVAPKPVELKIGDSIEFNGVKATVETATPGGNDIVGKPTFKVVVKYENTRSDTAAYNTTDWQIEYADGTRSKSTAIMPGSPKTLDSGDLAAGASIEAPIFFQSSGSVSKIDYQPNFMPNAANAAVWVLTD